MAGLPGVSAGPQEEPPARAVVAGGAYGQSRSGSAAAGQPGDGAADEGRGVEDEAPGGKHYLHAYVPTAIAKRVKDMQRTGWTAEAIILTAVRASSDRLPELIEKARGPVHTSGLFAGLEAIERRPGRPKKVEGANTRLQYTVSSQSWKDSLDGLAQRHKLKLSVLVRVALGAYFDIPVRLKRVA